MVAQPVTNSNQILLKLHPTIFKMEEHFGYCGTRYMLHDRKKKEKATRSRIVITVDLPEQSGFGDE